AFRFGQGGHFANGSRMNSAMDRDYRSRSSGAKDAPFFDCNSLNFVIIDDDQFDNLSMLTDFVSGTSAFGAERGEFLHWLGPQIVDHQIEPGSRQIDGHRLTHIT